MRHCSGRRLGLRVLSKGQAVPPLGARAKLPRPFVTLSVLPYQSTSTHSGPSTSNLCQPPKSHQDNSACTARCHEMRRGRTRRAEPRDATGLALRCEALSSSATECIWPFLSIGVPFVGVLAIRALPFGVYTRADFRTPISSRLRSGLRGRSHGFTAA